MIKKFCNYLSGVLIGDSVVDKYIKRAYLWDIEFHSRELKERVFFIENVRIAREEIPGFEKDSLDNLLFHYLPKLCDRTEKILPVETDALRNVISEATRKIYPDYN